MIDRYIVELEELLVLCIDLYEEKGKEMCVLFRVMWVVENNLLILNFEFSLFLESVDENGIFCEI